MKQSSFRMSLTCSLLTGLFFIIPMTGQSQDVTNQNTGDHFTPEQRKEIISTVRQALKEDPSLLEDGIQTLKEKASQQRNELSAKTLKDKKELLMHQLATDGLMGNPNGKTVLTEFYDPRCPYCKKMLPVLTKLAKENKDVKIILKVVPILGENSILQSQAIIAAAHQNNYVSMMKALMNNPSTVDLDTIRLAAQQLKLNPDQMTKDMKAASVTQALGDNIQLIHDLGIEGTPALVLNGSQLIPGAISYENLVKTLQKLPQ